MARALVTALQGGKAGWCRHQDRQPPCHAMPAAWGICGCGPAVPGVESTTAPSPCLCLTQDEVELGRRLASASAPQRPLQRSGQGRSVATQGQLGVVRPRAYQHPMLDLQAQCGNRASSGSGCCRLSRCEAGAVRRLR